MPDPSTNEESTGQRGRPSDYQPAFVGQAFKLALLGATDKEMADFFEVSEVTLNAWKKVHPDFLKSMLDGKMKADTEVANKLYEKALGAEWTQQQAFKIRTQTASGMFTEDVKIVDVRCAAPPDTQAISLWLRNRQSGKWRDKVDHEVSGPNGGPIQTKTVAEAGTIEAGRSIAYVLAEANRLLAEKNKPE